MINLIAAVGKRGQLGLGGMLPWHDPADLRWFKQMTMGGIVIVGYNTAQTLPPLPGRQVVVDGPGLTLDTLEGLYPASLIPPPTIWIAGGAKTYTKWLPHVRHCLVTMVDYDGEADTWMPRLWPEKS